MGRFIKAAIVTMSAATAVAGTIAFFGNWPDVPASWTVPIAAASAPRSTAGALLPPVVPAPVPPLPRPSELAWTVKEPCIDRELGLGAQGADPILQDLADCAAYLSGSLGSAAQTGAYIGQLPGRVGHAASGGGYRRGTIYAAAGMGHDLHLARSDSGGFGQGGGGGGGGVRGGAGRPPSLLPSDPGSPSAPVDLGHASRRPSGVVPVSPTPIPAAAWLLAVGLGGLAAARSRAVARRAVPQRP